MDCKDVHEKLPWFLNGSLDVSEASAIRAHLDDCKTCSEELRETHEAADIFGQHLPPEAITAYVMEEVAPPWDVETIEAHLKACSDCGAEHDLARRSFEAMAGEEPARSGPPIHVMALAAMLCLVMGVGWWFSMREASDLRDRLASPESGLAIYDLFPSDVDFRTVDSLEIAAGRRVVLRLHSELPSEVRPDSMRLESAEGAVLWQKETPNRLQNGDFSVVLPTGSLEPGRLNIELLDEGAVLERFTLQIR